MKILHVDENEKNIDKFILVPNLCLRFGKLEKNEK
jgi:hypothetical protein